MRNRLIKKINEARRKKSKLFCAYLTLGYPSVSFTARLIEELEKSGADIIELGFPFSDPLADGPTIQASSGYALRHNVKFNDALRLVRSLRKRGVGIPIIFFSYYNPIYQHGLARFAKDIRRAGFDGVISPDLSPEEDPAFGRALRKEKLSLVYLVAPTSSSRRIRMIARKTSGFIYLVSLKGVTGARRKLGADIAAYVAKIRSSASKAVLVGFGVSTPGEARRISKLGDGVIVGSAFIDSIRRSKSKLKTVASFASRMIRAAKGKG
ncbi:MAG: tryptophan synthase subunit alpha [Candidatus Omnitrophica bacterium]|nr:tryptophan synthase subunit alpha [Candidatus Omnitrophota bacterium]